MVISSRRQANVDKALQNLKDLKLERVHGITCHVGKEEDRLNLLKVVGTNLPRCSFLDGMVLVVLKQNISLTVLYTWSKSFCRSGTRAIHNTRISLVLTPLISVSVGTSFQASKVISPK